MPKNSLPENLYRLHADEEELRDKAIALLESDERLLLHFQISEQAMDLLDVFRQVETQDEDLKVIQMLGLRLFNALASSIKLTLSGYSQTSAMILRDVLETVFLIDLFRTDRPAITRWRLAGTQERLREFRPVRVRELLDNRDGFTKKRRAEMYSMFSELAGHPSMRSVAMLRPKGMDARNGPFIDPTALEAVASEMGRLAVQIGENVDPFFPLAWHYGDGTRLAFSQVKAKWIDKFYGSSLRK